MKKLFLSALVCFMTAGVSNASGADDCMSLMKSFNSEKKSEVTKLPSVDAFREMDFSAEELTVFAEAWSEQLKKVDQIRAKKYLNYVLTLKEKDRHLALRDFSQLDQREINSRTVLKFIELDKKVTKKIEAKKITSLAAQERYTELFYGCRALRPNDVNKNAAKDFKRFNFALNLGTLGASYAFYNMDKEMNAEWWTKLGYEVGITVLFTYVGGNIQTKATDTQIVKSLKSYFIGRVMGATDMIVYDPLFNNEDKKAESRLAEIKKLEETNPEFRKRIAELKKSYEERGTIRQMKDKLVAALKDLPEGISLGVKGKSVDENGVDWNNLGREDFDRPEVQDVLLAAAMAEVYQQSKGEWIETSNAGVDRYVFNSLFYGMQIPKSIVQNFITYQILCMGQDTPKVAFSQAVLFNVSANFIVNQVLYGYREKAINQ